VRDVAASAAEIAVSPAGCAGKTYLANWAVTLAQLRIIVTATYPAVRAIEALAATLPLFLLLSVQMLLDLVALGLVVRAFVGAVQLARQQAAPVAAPAVGPGLPPGQAPQQGDDVQ
jgi:hypothetical protein